MSLLDKAMESEKTAEDKMSDVKPSLFIRILGGIGFFLLVVSTLLWFDYVWNGFKVVEGTAFIAYACISVLGAVLMGIELVVRHILIHEKNTLAKLDEIAESFKKSHTKEDQ